MAAIRWRARSRQAPAGGNVSSGDHAVRRHQRRFRCRADRRLHRLRSRCSRGASCPRRRSASASPAASYDADDDRRRRRPPASRAQPRRRRASPARSRGPRPALKQRGRLRVRRQIEAAGIAPAIAERAVDEVFGDIDDDALLDAGARRGGCAAADARSTRRPATLSQRLRTGTCVRARASTPEPRRAARRAAEPRPVQ